MEIKKIEFPKLSDITKNLGFKFEKGQKPKLVKPTKYGIIFYVLFFLDIFLLNHWFNTGLMKKLPYMYNTLIKLVPSMKNLGWFALLGKTAKAGGKIVKITKIPIVKQLIILQLKKVLFLDGAIIVILFFMMKGKKKNTSQGTAKWGDLKEVDFKPGNDKFFGSSLISNKGVVLGRLQGVTLRDNNKTHICVVAPTRTGKGVSIIIPTLIDSWADGVLVLDIKGENYQLTSGARKEKFDNLILRFAPKSENSCKYNALSEVRLMSPQETEDVKLIGDIICGVADAKGDNKYWVESASGLIFAIAFYVLYRNFLQRPKYVYENGKKKPVSDASMIDVINFLTDPNAKEDIQTRLKTIAQDENMIEKYGKDEETKEYVRNKLMELYGGGVDRETVEHGNHPKFARGFIKNGLLADQTFASVMGQATTNLSVFDMSTVAKNTSASDFRIFDLMNWKRPVSLYLVIPPADIIVLAPLIKMLILQIVNLLTPEIDYTNQIAHKWRMLMLLDEFPAIGKMESLETGIGYFAGYGMKMMVVLQSLDQLFKIYGDKNGFLSNCQAQIFYTSNDKTTANYVSELLGKETLEQYTQSNKSAGTIMKTESQAFIGRNLLMPDEVGRFPSDKIIVKLSGRNPVKADKIVYFLEEQYSSLVKIPYVYSESCYDETKQYIKLTPAQKKKYKDYPYKYVPYPEALKVMKDDIDAKRAAIKETTPEKIAEMDDEDKKRFEISKKNLKKQIKGFKLYIDMFNKLSKEDERIKSMLKNVKKEMEKTKANKVTERNDDADKIVVKKKNISVEDTINEIKSKSTSIKTSGFIASSKEDKKEENNFNLSLQKDETENEEKVDKVDEIRKNENLEETEKDESLDKLDELNAELEDTENEDFINEIENLENDALGEELEEVEEKEEKEEKEEDFDFGEFSSGFSSETDDM